MKSLIFASILILSLSSAQAKLVCNLKIGGGQEKKIEGLSNVSIHIDPFLCQAKKEEGEMVRLRITSALADEVVNDLAYNDANETLYTQVSQVLDFATCSCHLE